MDRRPIFVRIIDVAKQSVLFVRADEEFAQSKGGLSEVGVQLDVVDVAVRELLVVQAEADDGLFTFFIDACCAERVEMGDLGHEQLSVLFECSQVTDLETLRWAFGSQLEFIRQRVRLQVEEGVSLLRELSLVGKDVRVVAGVSLRIFEGDECTI